MEARDGWLDQRVGRWPSGEGRDRRSGDPRRCWAARRREVQQAVGERHAPREGGALRGEEKRELGFGEGIVYTADLAGLHRWIKSTATIALRVGLWPSARPRPGCYYFLFIFFFSFII